MKKTKLYSFIQKVTLILIVFITGLGSIQLSAATDKNADTCEILLIGSSYFNYNNLADIIKNLTESSGIETYIEMHGQNGLYLSDHASSPATEVKINERDWDYVVLQGVGVLVAYPEHFTDHPVYPALETLHDKINANCESTRMIFCLPWAFEDGMTWYQGWTDTYEDMQIHVYNNTLQYSDEIGFEIAPVGWAWYGVLDEYNYPLHYLHMSDWNHPTFEGSYLMACVIYSTVFQESTIGNPYYGDIQQDTAEYFQQVASDTVLNNLDLWNITPLVSLNENSFQKSKLQLYQNYPNPFGSITTIKYLLPKEAHVKLEIYNYLGISIATLVDENQLSGYKEVQFDAANISDGTYFYRVTSGNKSQTKLLIVD